MVCGRFARRIAWVMLLMGMVTRETLFTLPKPLVHLFYSPVSIRHAGSSRRGGVGLHGFKVGAPVLPVMAHAQSK